MAKRAISILVLLLSGCTVLIKHEYMTQLPRECGELKKTLLRQNNFPVKIGFTHGFPEKYKKPILKAARHWNEVLNNKLFVLAEQGDIQLSWDAGVISKGQFEPDVLAYTQNFQMENKWIVKSEIHFNAFKYKFSSLRPARRGEWDLEEIAAHELGHALGLLHYSSGTMIERDPSSPWFVRNVSPSAVMSFRCLYPDSDHSLFESLGAVNLSLEATTQRI